MNVPVMGMAVAAAAGIFLSLAVWMLAGKRFRIFFLPVFLILGMGRASQERGICNRELALGLDGQPVAVEGKLAAVRPRQTGWVLELTGCSVQTERAWEDGNTSRPENAWEKADMGQIGEARAGGQAVRKKDAREWNVREPQAGLGRLRRVQIYTDENMDGQMQELSLGNLLEVRGKAARMEQARNPGEFDFRKYYQGFGQTYRVLAESLVVRESRRWVCREFLRRQAVEARSILEQIAPPGKAGIFCAALLGDKTALDGAVRELYQDHGIAHLLAVSGLHLSLLGGAVYGILRLLGAGYGAGGILAGIFLAGYSVLAGSSPSVERALVMTLCGFGAAWLGRTYDGLSALALSALVLLWKSPCLVFQAGVQLSFGALLGIGAVAPCLETWMRGISAGADHGRLLRQSLAVAAGIQVATVPVQLYHFYQIPLWGILLNLVLVPFMGMVLASGIAGVVLGRISIRAGRFAIGSGVGILSFYEQMCRLCDCLPGRLLVAGRPRGWQLLVYYGVLAGLLFYLWETYGRAPCGDRAAQGPGEPAYGSGPTRGSRKSAHGSGPTQGSRGMACGSGPTQGPRGPVCGGGPVPGRRRRWQAFLPVLGLGLQAFLLAPWPVKGLEVTFLDVGQGDGICLRTREMTLLVDGGSSDEKGLGRYRLVPFLKSRAQTEIDYGVVSHGDMDHISGLLYLLEEETQIQIRHLVLPAAGREDEAYDRLVSLVTGSGGEILWMKQGDVLTLGELSLTCLYPDASVRTDRNQQSLVLRVDYGGFHMLLTGDMSADGERDLLSGDQADAGLSGIQILKVAHHGSDTATSQAWLERIAPGFAVVSYGEGNRYGHPGAQVLKRLKEGGTVLFETGKQGAVTVETDGVTARFHTFLEPDVP